MRTVDQMRVARDDAFRSVWQAGDTKKQKAPSPRALEGRGIHIRNARRLRHIAGASYHMSDAIGSQKWQQLDVGASNFSEFRVHLKTCSSCVGASAGWK